MAMRSKTEMSIPKAGQRWKNIQGGEKRELTFSNGRTMLMSHTRMEDGVTLTVGSEITDLRGHRWRFLINLKPQ